MGINATRRGVKTCPLCSKKIGYRSKQCKYCSAGKQKRTPRKCQSKEVRREGERIVDVEIGVEIDNETEVSTSKIVDTVELSSTSEDAKKAVEDTEPVLTESFDQDPQQNINAIDSIAAEMSEPNSSEVAAGKRSYHTSLQDLIHTLLVQNQNSSVYVAPETEGQADKAGTEDTVCNQEEAEVVSEETVPDNPVVPAGPVGSPENAYDANSVALFLGHLAQQNGKKIRTALDPVSNNAQPSTSASSLIRFKTKHVVVEDGLSCQAKYRRIRPKSIDESSAVMEIPPSVDTTVEEDMGDSVVDVKPTEAQLR